MTSFLRFPDLKDRDQSFQGVTDPALERDRRASLPPPYSPRLRSGLGGPPSRNSMK